VEEGGKILVEGGVLSGEEVESGCYVKPAETKIRNCTTRNFCSVYLLKYSGTVENALELQNGVAQGLSSLRL
jgi:aldehyde dehydrogenase (NAD+)